MRCVLLVACVMTGGLVKADEKSDAKVEKLKKASAEAVVLFRDGKAKEGTAKIIDSVMPYKKLTPAECTPEEALAVAELYARIQAIIGRSVKEEQAKGWRDVTISYANRGGLRGNEFAQWFEKIVTETAEAYRAGEKKK